MNNAVISHVYVNNLYGSNAYCHDVKAFRQHHTSHTKKEKQGVKLTSSYYRDN